MQSGLASRSPGIVVEVVEGKESLAAFIDAPTKLYEGLAGFQPALFMEQDMALSPNKGSFFQHGRARYFLARRSTEIVGRLSAQIVDDIPLGLPEKTGMFGCCDARDDAEAVSALFAAAEAWLKEQGCTHAFGPVTLNMNGEPGLLVEGQSLPRMIMTPWHPAYLGALVEQAGYARRKDLLNWRLEERPADNRGFANRIGQGALGPTAKLRNLDKKNVARDIRFTCDLYNDAWSKNEFFIPLRPIDMQDLEKSVKPLLPPEACTFVEIDGEPAGVLVVIPNLFEAFRGLGSKPSPLGWIKLGWRLLRPRFSSARIILMGVSRRYAGTVKGMAIAITLIEEMIKRRDKYENLILEAGWVLEDNEALNALLKRAFKPARRMRLYIKKL